MEAEKQRKTGKAWAHSSREWMRGGSRGAGEESTFQYAQIKLKSDFVRRQVALTTLTSGV